MKHCPTCKKTFTDQNLIFCTDDGTPLLSVVTDNGDEATVVRPSGGDSEPGAAGSARISEAGSVPPYQPPGSYVPPGYSGQSKRRTWPWVVGILAVIFVVFAGLLITAALMIPKSMFATRTERDLNANSQPNNSNSNLNERNYNSGSNSANENENENKNNNSATDEDTTAPTDNDQVLQNLKDVEQEWTVANINADKKKLDRILADDYVGTTADGKPQGKAEYLRTATRDTAIQKWNFEDLKLSLTGDRATLRGIVRFEIRDEAGQTQDLSFRFIDKFVWRDSRWQATASTVTPLREGTPA